MNADIEGAYKLLHEATKEVNDKINKLRNKQR